ncbi:MAG TPA: lysophospholipase [Burkholderiaceae bacterium]|nr:lysophospholipase [Rhodoferax sp.]HQZ04539.1 lysophospholipase [Burkholderiaceae bacterium]
MPDTSFSPLTARDGTNLVVMDWPLQKAPVRGVVLIVHGLGEHAWRYDALAQELNSWGFAVRAYDQFGHGESMGQRGALPSDDRLLQDLAEVVDESRARMHDNTPLIVLGHSMGGLVAARFVSLGMRKLDGLVLSSPALDPGLDPLQRLLLAVLPRLLPNLRVGNGLKPEFISHDAQVVAQYKADPLVHDRISARLAKFIADGGPATIACAPSWALPTLLLYAGADKLVDPAGSRAFASAAPPTVLTSRCFDALYHEIFNESEPGRRQVLAQLKSWLDARF